MKSPSILEPLRDGPFARYMAGETISMIGTWMQGFAQGYVLTTLTSQAWVLGTINFAMGLPMLLLALIGGNLADRYDKRRILFIALAVQILAAVMIGHLIGTNQIKIWHIVVAAACLGVTAAFEVPTVSAFVPELVARDQIGFAVSIDRSVFHFTRIVGPAVGGWLIGRYGIAPAYYLNALSFLALWAALMTIRSRPVESAAEEEKRHSGIAEGLAYVRKDAPTARMILLITATTFFVAPFLVVLMPLYSRVTLGLPAEKMGWLMGVSGVGSLSGALGFLAIPRGYRATALKCAATAVVTGVTGLALAPSLAFASAAMVCLTVGLSTNFALSNTVIQERVPGYMRGRVSSIASLAFAGLIPFSGMLIAGLVDLLGMRQALSACACGYAITAFFLLAGVRQLASAPSQTAEPAPAP